MTAPPWIAPSPPAQPAQAAQAGDTPLATRVRDEVLALVLRGELKPGQRIGEPEMAARLGVSRVPVREALRALESSGLLEARKHAGVFVRLIDERELSELYELRSVLDGHAGRRAAELPDAPRQALVRRLSRGLREMNARARCADVLAYYGANLRFHWAIVEAAGNDTLARSYRSVVQLLHLARLRNLSQDTGLAASQHEHQAIVAALAAGDARHCQALLAQHVTAAHGRLQSAPPASPRAEETCR